MRGRGEGVQALDQCERLEVEILTLCAVKMHDRAPRITGTSQSFMHASPAGKHCRGTPQQPGWQPAGVEIRVGGGGGVWGGGLQCCICISMCTISLFCAQEWLNVVTQNAFKMQYGAIWCDFGRYFYRSSTFSETEDCFVGS